MKIINKQTWKLVQIGQHVCENIRNRSFGIGGWIFEEHDKDTIYLFF